MESQIIADTKTIVYTNNTNNYPPHDLQSLCTSIETLSKINQVEILRIFNKHTDMVINENKYGIHINMTDVPDEIIVEIRQFLEFVRQQENDLSFIDFQLDTSKNYMLQEHKENHPYMNNEN